MNITDIILEDFLKVNVHQLVRIPMIVVYEKPKDYPTQFVARLWNGNKPTRYAILKNSIDDIRAAIPPMHRIGRHPGDDPVIQETWI